MLEVATRLPWRGRARDARALGHHPLDLARLELLDLPFPRGLRRAGRRLPHGGHERFRRVAQVPADLPDVDFQAVGARGGQTLFQLVTVAADGCRLRHNLAVVMRQAGPKHIDENGMHAGIGQDPCGFAPVPGIEAQPGMVPDTAEFRVFRVLDAGERLRQVPALRG